MTKTAAVAINLGIIVVLVGGVLLLVKHNIGKQTAEAAVVSTQATEVQVRDPSKEDNQDTTGYNWRATYQVAGKTYTVSETEDVTYDPTVKYKICYDPKNPANGSLARPDTHCGKLF